MLLISTLGFTHTSATEPPKVVMIPGWHGDGSIFRTMIPVLENQGLDVIDFDPNTAGTQALSHDAGADGGNLDIPALANQVEEKIRNSNAPYKINLVAHSMGGLIARYLIEEGQNDPLIDNDWADRVDKLIMLGTPNHGTWEAYVGQLSPLFGDWAASAAQMTPSSSFLDMLGYNEPAGEEYITVGGDPWYLPGFDGVVPSDSPHLTGSEQYTIAGHHGELATLPQAIDLVLETLGYVPADIGEALNLVGTASIRLEMFKLVADHEWGTEEYHFDIYADRDGGNDNYELINTLNHNQDGPFTWNPGNSGPTTTTFAIPGTSPRMDIKVVVREDNDLISTFYFRDIMHSENVDGVDYYQDTAADPSGGTNTMRVSVNGITSDLSRTVDVKVRLNQVRVDNDGDWLGNGENYFKTWVGSTGHEIHYSHWTEWSGEDTYYIYDTYQQNSGYDAIVYQGRMVKSDSLHIKLEIWDNDSPSSDDHLNGDVNQYYTAQYAAGSYYIDAGDAAWWYTVTVD